MFNSNDDVFEIWSGVGMGWWWVGFNKVNVLIIELLELDGNFFFNLMINVFGWLELLILNFDFICRGEIMW